MLHKQYYNGSTKRRSTKRRSTKQSRKQNKKYVFCLDFYKKKKHRGDLLIICKI